MVLSYSQESRSRSRHPADWQSRSCALPAARYRERTSLYRKKSHHADAMILANYKIRGLIRPLLGLGEPLPPRGRQRSMFGGVAALEQQPAVTQDPLYRRG